MTATIKRPGPRSTAQRRRVRFSSLETLGFTDVASSWSDSPTIDFGNQQGRHVAPPSRPEEVADWRPEAFGRGLEGSDIRWGLITMVVVLIAGIAAAGYWLYQRPAAIEQAAETELTVQARALESELVALTEFNQNLLIGEPITDASGLDSVENVARTLFNISGSVADVDFRSAASQAAGSALGGVRLARQTDAYRAAVLPMLAPPPLETDPDLIALDEAARLFGTWQLGFDDVRTALPGGVLPDVTEQLNVLSGDLSSFLGRYVDALRGDDKAAVESVQSALGSRLGVIEEDLIDSIEDIQESVQVRVDESLAALRLLPSG